MPALPIRRTATSVLCTALLLGAAAPALAVTPDSGRADARSASRAPVPRAAALQGQTKALADLGAVLVPVTGLLNAALKSDNGQLSAGEAKKLGDAARDAVAQAKGAAPAPAQPSAGSPAAEAAAPAQLPANLLGDVLDALGKAIDGLLGAVTSGKAEQVEPAAEVVVKELVSVSTATLAGQGIPAADLPGLPAS